MEAGRWSNVWSRIRLKLEMKTEKHTYIGFVLWSSWALHLVSIFENLGHMKFNGRVFFSIVHGECSISNSYSICFKPLSEAL